jgi:flagellar motility protein MotE (MotC chaperone)
MTAISKKRTRFLRLLPGVVILGIALLTLKTNSLVHGAWAEEGGEKKPATSQSAALAAPHPASNPDFAGGDDQIASASEVDVLTSLSKRRAELDAREKQLAMQANVLAAAEQRVDGKINQLKALQDQITKLLAQRDTEQNKQVAALVKTYSSMKPKDAARIFNSLSDDVLVPVAQEMKSDVLAPVLANMDSAAAQKLTIKLANRLAVPDVATPPAPPGPQAPLAPPAAAPAPAQAAAPAQPAPPKPAG